MARADFPDKNQNGYPDAFEVQESQILAQMAARRKAYMQRYGKAETRYIGTQTNPVEETNETYIAPVQKGSEANDVENLFR